ncbi:MAG: hypothetical protein AAF449_02895 [Myxococcota bacterium]
MASSTPVPSGFSTAFKHPLNLLMLGAFGVCAAVTGSWLPLLIAAGTEAIWLTYGMRARAHRDYARWLAERTRVRSRISTEQYWVRRASEDDRRRFLVLDEVRRDIRKLVEDHDSLSLEMMSGELHKVDRLLEAFARVAATAHTQSKILSRTDVAATEVDEGDELSPARKERTRALQAQVDEARSQMSRVERELALIRDQVATMRHPEDLAGVLDDLVQTVEIVEATGRETEALSAGRRKMESASIGH